MIVASFEIFRFILIWYLLQELVYKLSAFAVQSSDNRFVVSQQKKLLTVSTNVKLTVVGAGDKQYYYECRKKIKKDRAVV